MKLYGYRTTFKMTIWTSSFKLVYGKSRHLPVDIEHKAYREINLLNLDLSLAQHRLSQTNALDKFRLNAYENARIFKEKTKKWHDRLIKPKEFHEGEKTCYTIVDSDYSPENSSQDERTICGKTCIAIWGDWDPKHRWNRDFQCEWAQVKTLFCWRIF